MRIKKYALIYLAICSAFGLPKQIQAQAADKASDWSRFRGPTGMGTSESSGLPVEWGPENNVIWKTALPGPGASSPIVFGDHIYLTCYTGYLVPGEPGGKLEDLKRHLVALRQEDGRLIWTKTVPAKMPEERRIRDHGYAANTPVADESGVVVFHGKSGVVAYNHKGLRQWEADVGSGTSGWGSSASPVFFQGLVLINASVESESLIALDRKTGQEKWRAGDIKEAWNTPIIVKAPNQRDELVIATHGKIRAFDPASGKPLWVCDTEITWYMVPSLVAHQGVVYALGGRSGIAGLAVRTGGQGDVTSTHRLWTSRKGSNVTSPVIHDGHLYWMHEKLGIAYCADPSNGEIVYEERVERAGQIYASALLSDGRIYYTDRGGRTFVIAAKPEFELLSVNALKDGGRFDASPAVTGSRILIRSDRNLYGLGK